MTVFSREIKLERLYRGQQNRNSFMKSGLYPLDLIAIIGLVFFIMSCFLTLTPISENNLLQGPMGMPSMLFAFMAIVALYKKNYFAAFFIAMFNAFYLTHEVIIMYDSKAIQMGRELGADGWFRPVIMIFSDALQSEYGAFWGVIGSGLAVLAIIFAWIHENHKLNAFTAENATDNASAYDSFFEDIEDDNAASETDVFFVSILPADNVSVALGSELKFTPEARDVAGRLISSDPADFVWINADKNGLFLRKTKGNYAVSAEYQGKQSNNTVVNVE